MCGIWPSLGETTVHLNLLFCDLQHCDITLSIKHFEFSHFRRRTNMGRGR